MEPPVLLPEYFLCEEQIADVQANPILTPGQLHLLRQQIDALRRINVQLRALKYWARTGTELLLPQHAASGRGGGRGRGRGGRSRASSGSGLVVGGSGGGRGRKPGRGRGRGSKRGREDESEEDDSIVARTSEEEEEEEEEEAAGRSTAAGGSGSKDDEEDESELTEEEGEEEEQSADSSESEEDYTIQPASAPRRTGRVRQPRAAVAEAAAEASESEGEGEEEEEEKGGEGKEAEAGQRQRQRQQQGTAAAAPEPAGPADEELGQQGGSGVPPTTSAGKVGKAGKSQARGSRANPAGGSSGGGRGGSQAAGGGSAKRKGLFMLVSESGASRTALKLPQLKPVKPAPKAVAAAAAEDSSSDEPDGGTAAGSKGPKEKGMGGREEEEGEEEQEDEEEVPCSVCGDGDGVEDNLILLCEGKGCSVAVHQLCYGVAKVPEGKWLCDACKAKLKPSAANCCICPVVGGAVRKVTSLGRVAPAGKAKSVYCHLACALWVPEIELSDHERMAGVRLDKLTSVRVKLRCELCKQTGGGAVQCAFGTCCRSFHVLCGRAAGQQLTFRATDGEPLAFCELHSKPAFEKMVEELVDGKRPLEPQGALLEEEEEDGDS